MSAKTSANHARRWTAAELEGFAEILADSENNFASCLEKLALKKSSNNEVFQHIKNLFEKLLESEDFKKRNEKHFLHFFSEKNQFLSCQICDGKNNTAMVVRNLTI